MNPSTSAAHDVVAALIAHGAGEVVLAPGSRSGPLALALHDADRAGLLRLHVRVDERTAGFLALGMAKASRQVVPVVTTSGTAVANLHPAVLEARHAGVRLLVISADRPAVLRGTGANQTTDQRHMFGDIAYAGMAAGDDVPAGIGSLLERMGAAPAQLNVEFDQPLIAAQRPSCVAPPAAQSATPPPGAVELEPDLPAPYELDALKHTVVVAGDNAGPPARHLAEAGNWPLFAEPSSGARTGTHPIGAYRLVLAHSPLAAKIERVVVYGHPTLSRPVTELLARTDLETIVVGADLRRYPNRGEHVYLVPAAEAQTAADTGWIDAWRAHGTAADEAISAHLGADLSGHTVAREVMAALPPGGLLYAGSSNPIRDLDLMGAPHLVGERRLTLANRGLSGIDGTVSSAIGAALARPSPKALAYMGDLTFLHDANGLLIGPGEPRPDLTIVVASDDGGSIFATLEQGAAEYADAFERVYGTPTGADIGALCQGFGVPHEVVDSCAGLARELAQEARGIRVIEVRIDRSRRRAVADELGAAVRVSIQAG